MTNAHKKYPIAHLAIVLFSNLLAQLSYGQSGDSATLTFGAEFEGLGDPNHPTIPCEYPGGNLELGGWTVTGSYGSSWRNATEQSVQIQVKDNDPMAFCVKVHETSAEYLTGSCTMVVDPPPWARKVTLKYPDDPEDYSYSKWGDNWYLDDPWYLGSEPDFVLPEFSAANGNGRSPFNLTITSVEGCSSCSTCSDTAQTNYRAEPTLKKVYQSANVRASAILPIGNNCCGNAAETSVSWNSAGLSSATSVQNVSLESFEVFAGTAIRFPADSNLTLEQLKIGDALCILTPGTNVITWGVYDATNIGPRLNGGSGPFPLTKVDGSLLPLLQDVTITQIDANNVSFLYKRSGIAVDSFLLSRDTVNNIWSKENVLSATKETLAVTVEGTGWNTSRHHYLKGPDNEWAAVNWTGEVMKIVSGREVAIEEYMGGDLVASHDYYADGSLKWTLNEDGSWTFYEYPARGETKTYRPYGDTAFPGASWIPSTSSLEGIRCEDVSGDSLNRTVNSTYVWGQSSGSWSEGLYAKSFEIYSDAGTSRTTSITQSDFVFKGFRGKNLVENEGRGVSTLHEYTRGNVSSAGFTTHPDGNHVLEISTKGGSEGNFPELVFYDDSSLILHPITIGAKFEDAETREVTIYDPQGRTIYSATHILDGSGYSPSIETVTTYVNLENNEGSVTSIARDGRVVSVVSSLSDGTWEESVDEAGVVRTTQRDVLGRVTTETLPGPEGSAIARSHVYDGLVTNIATTGGGLSSTTTETRDLRGRVVSSTDEAGITTSYSYSDGGRTTTMTRPGGVTEITTNYRDGRFKQRSGTGVLREFASYSIDPLGNEVTKRSSGPAVSGDHGARWVESTTDILGRPTSVRRPGPPNGTGGRQADVTESYSYDLYTGRLLHIVSSARPGIYQVVEGDLLGTYSASGTATHDGPLVPDSSDRFSSNTRTYEKRGDHFWEVNTRRTYVQGATPVVSSSDTRLWVGNGEMSVTTDSAGVTRTSTTVYNTGDRSVVTTATTASPSGGTGSPINSTIAETTIDGYLTSRSPPGATQAETYYYDGLGREIRRTDVRNASTRTIYNNLGQVEKVVNHLGQSMSYVYYPSGHQSAGRVHTQTDTAGKVIETVYDALGRVFSVAGTAAYPLSYTYNDFGGMETLTTYGTQTAVNTWVNDHPTGLLLEKKYDGQAAGVKYTYLGDGRLESRTWRRGDKTTYGYNGSGNLFGDLDTIDYPAGTPDVSFSNFDRRGRPGTVTEGGNTTTLAYDPQTGGTSPTYAAGHSLLPGLSVVPKAPDFGRSGGYTLKQGTSTVEDVAYGYDTSGRYGEINAGTHQVDYKYYPGTSILRETTHSVQGTGTPRIEARHVDLAGRLTGIITTVPDGGGRRIAASAGYWLNNRGQREKLTREDGTSWNYGYNDRGEVISGLKKLANGQLAAGLQFGYQYDAIGNREWAKSGGTASGQNLRTVNYTTNVLNQYNSITTPGSFDVLVRSPNTVGITVNGTSASVASQGTFHRAQAVVTNTDGAWADLTITSVGQNSVTGNRWLPPATFSPQYDEDGNLKNDGRWAYSWDGENRLVSMTTNPGAGFPAGVPKLKLEFAYDFQSQRIQKKVTNLTTNEVISDERFVYDAWNLLAVFDGSGATLSANPKQTYLWGLDLSGTLQGAGGISGLLAVNNVAPQSVCYPAYDGNGNIIAWIGTDGDTLQRIDYDPFGNAVTREGEADFEAPDFGFSTKYTDEESGLLYYGFRFYDPVNGRWPSRDPLEEMGGNNLYQFVANDSINSSDINGCIEGDVRNVINVFAVVIAGVTGDTLTSDMIWHYAGGDGSDYVMTHGQAKKVKTASDINVLGFRGIGDIITKVVSEKKDYELNESGFVENFATSSNYGNNALGNFNIRIKGKIKCTNIPGQRWEFVGSLKYEDRFDFDWDNMGGRTAMGKVKTIVGSAVLNGKPFKVRSGEYSATQKASETEMQW